MPAPPFGQDILGWLAVAVGTIATFGTIAAAMYWMVWPGETQPDHPKYAILKRDR